MVDIADKIKDALGIFDDAQDFLEKIKKESSQTKALFQKFTSLSKDQIGLINRVQSEGRDERKIIQIMEQLDIDRPLLIGKNVLRRLQDSRRMLSKLSSKIRNVPPEAREGIRAALDRASRQLDAGVKQHLTSIRVFSDIQDKRKRFFRGLVKTGAVVAGTAAAGTLFGASAAAAIRAISIAGTRGGFDPAVVDVARFLDEGLSELETNISTGRIRLGAFGV